MALRPVRSSRHAHRPAGGLTELQQAGAGGSWVPASPGHQLSLTRVVLPTALRRAPAASLIRHRPGCRKHLAAPQSRRTTRPGAWPPRRAGRSPLGAAPRPGRPRGAGQRLTPAAVAAGTTPPASTARRTTPWGWAATGPRRPCRTSSPTQGTSPSASPPRLARGAARPSLRWCCPGGRPLPPNPPPSAHLQCCSLCRVLP